MTHENLKGRVAVVTGGGGVLCGDFAKVLARQGVKVAVLDLNEAAAQKVADYAIKCGVQFIWNFTPTVLKVPKSVKVYYENIISSFMQMQNSTIS